MTRLTHNKYWKIFWKVRSLEFMRFTEYRADLWFWMTVSILWTLFHYFFFWLITAVRPEIAGWNRLELFLFLSIYSTLDALTWSFFYPSTREYTRAITSGQLSSLLIKPIHPAYMILIGRMSFHNLPRFIIGLVGIWLCLRALHLTPAPTAIIASTGLLFVATIFLYTLWLFTGTLTFWVERFTTATDIMPALRRIYQFPSTMYTGVVGFVLSTVIPLTQVTTLPSLALLGRHDWKSDLLFTATTLTFLLGWILFFHHSLRRYTSAGN